MFFFFFFFDDPFVERLTQAMEKQDLTPETLALRTGVSLATVHRWLDGTYKPRFVNLPKVAHVLNVSTDYLHGKDDLF